MKPLQAREVEHACSLILKEVSRTFISVRAVIERVKPPVPRGLLNAVCLGVLRNYKLAGLAARHCGLEVDEPFPRSIRGWLKLIAAYEALLRPTLPLERISMKTGVDMDILRCIRESSPEELVARLPRLRRLSILYSVPLWVIEKLEEVNPPGGVEALLEAFQRPTPLWLRFNTSRLTREQALRMLEKAGIEAEPDSVLPDLVMVRRAEPGAVERLPRSLFYPQDRAAALPANLLASRLSGPLAAADLFSAPGNKAAQLSWRLPGTYVAAVDLSHRRLLDEVRLHSQQGVWLADYASADARSPPLRRGSLDAVIVDPDCTSMGRLGHSPETRLFLETTGPGILRRLVRLQEESLSQAITLARRGGYVVYSTCTLTREENEDVVRRVAEDTGVEVVDAEPRLGVEGLIPGVQRIYPHLHNCTGGFAALLYKP